MATSTASAPADRADRAAHRVAAERPARHRRPALDGVRALAIVAVMTYHATGTFPRAGFMGVDIFFVLSGYLIAGLLIREDWTWGSIDLPAFYLRRARRLFPALILTVLATAAICPRVLSQQAVAGMRGDALASLFYVANWRFIAVGDSYFAQFGDPSPYRHMWTLSVEEQFYLILPVLLIGLIALTRADRRRITAALVGLAAVSAGWMAVLYRPGTDTSRVYYGTDTRAQELLLGAALAAGITLIDKRSPAARRAVATVLGAIAGFVVVMLLLVFTQESDLLYRGGFFLFAIAVAALIASVELVPQGPVARVLGVAAWAWIGRISYGLYLWHWPVFLVAAHSPLTGLPLYAVEVAATFAIATASFYLVEEPIRTGRLRALVGRSASRVIGWLCLPLTAVAALALTPSVSSLVVVAQPGQGSHVGHVNAAAALKVLVLGDSVGFSLGYAFKQADHPKVQVTGDVLFGCGSAEQHIAVNGVPQTPDPTQCRDVFGRWAADVADKKPDVVVWSLGAWEVYDHVVDGRILKVGSPQYATYLTSRLDLGLSKLGTAQVVIPDVACYQQPSYVVNGQDMAPDRNDPARARAVNQILTSFAARHPGQVHIYDVAAKLCPTGTPRLKVNGVQVRSDGVHYTVDGARLFWSWVMPTLGSVTGIKVD